MLSALFDWEGNRLEGNDDLHINRIPEQKRDDVWFYRVIGPDNYVFVHMPVIEGVYPDFALTQGTKKPGRYFLSVCKYSIILSTGRVSYDEVADSLV